MFLEVSWWVCNEHIYAWYRYAVINQLRYYIILCKICKDCSFMISGRKDKNGFKSSMMTSGHLNTMSPLTNKDKLLINNYLKLLNQASSQSETSSTILQTSSLLMKWSVIYQDQLPLSLQFITIYLVIKEIFRWFNCCSSYWKT